KQMTPRLWNLLRQNPQSPPKNLVALTSAPAGRLVQSGWHVSVSAKPRPLANPAKQAITKPNLNPAMEMATATVHQVIPMDQPTALRLIKTVIATSLVAIVNGCGAHTSRKSLKKATRLWSRSSKKKLEPKARA